MFLNNTDPAKTYNFSRPHKTILHVKAPLEQRIKQNIRFLVQYTDNQQQSPFQP